MIAEYIDPSKIRATRVEGAIYPSVELIDKMVILGAQIKRVFPLSKPNEFLSLQDGAGKEMAILRTTVGLDSESARVFAEELDRRYFTPIITAIKEVIQESGMWRFVVETQRGNAEFYVRNWRDNAFEISVNRWQIHSVDGGRFDIPNMEALDLYSRKQMARLL